MYNIVCLVSFREKKHTVGIASDAVLGKYGINEYFQLQAFVENFDYLAFLVERWA